MEAIVALGVKHLLIDLPSVDPEFDQGALLAHRIFWGYQNGTFTRTSCTITEMARIPKHVQDGEFVISLQTLDWESDAVPSNPVLYPVKKEVEQE